MPMAGSITSLQNVHVRTAYRLKTKKRDRYREQQYLVEGYRLVHHALSRGHRPAFAFFTPSFAESPQGGALVQLLAAGSTPVWEVSPEVLAHVADTVTPQGIVAALPMVIPDLERIQQASYVLVLDAVSTPGNLGTILRTALATGVGGVVCTHGTVDPYSPKVVRGGMGAQMDLPMVADVAWERVPRMLAGKRVMAAAAEGSRSLWQVNWTLPTALIIGSEAHGIGPEARALATELVSIPMVPEAESLNAAIAAAAFMLEAQRQRLAAGV